MKTLILTGCDAGMDSIGTLTAANHRAYAQRHGYQFERVTQYEPGSHPSWQKLRLLAERLPKFDRVMWLDADTVVTNPSVTVADIAQDRHGLIVSTDWTYPAAEHAIKHFSMGNFIFTNCEGSFEILRLASLRREWANAKLWEQQAVQEEYLANEGIRAHVHVLPRRALNSVPATPTTTGPEPWEAGDFLCHMTYLGNDERERVFWDFDRAGLRYSATQVPDWHEPIMCADVRHIALMEQILTRIPFARALEVGVWRGASSSAFMAGLDRGTLGHYTACDVGIQDEFLKVVNGRERVTIRQMASDELLAGHDRWDVIFLDGDHSLPTGRSEVRHMIRRQPRMIFAHDVSADIVGFAHCEGPAHIYKELLLDGWLIIVDNAKRPGEKTERGFMVATKDSTLYREALRCFAMVCY